MSRLVAFSRTTCIRQILSISALVLCISSGGHTSRHAQQLVAVSTSPMATASLMHQLCRMQGNLWNCGRLPRFDVSKLFTTGWVTAISSAFHLRISPASQPASAACLGPVRHCVRHLPPTPARKRNSNRWLFSSCILSSACTHVDACKLTCNPVTGLPLFGRHTRHNKL